MVVDTSAIVAILLDEPEAESFAKRIAADLKRLISALSALEAAIVLQRLFSQTDLSSAIE